MFFTNTVLIVAIVHSPPPHWRFPEPFLLLRFGLYHVITHIICLCPCIFTSLPTLFTYLSYSLPVEPTTPNRFIPHSFLNPLSLSRPTPLAKHQGQTHLRLHFRQKRRPRASSKVLRYGLYLPKRSPPPPPPPPPFT